MELFECATEIQPLLLPKEIGRFYDRMPVHGCGASTPVSKLEELDFFIDTTCAHPEWDDSDLGFEDICYNNNSIRELCCNYKLLNDAVNKWLKEHDVYNLVNDDDIYTFRGKEIKKHEIHRLNT